MDSNPVSEYVHFADQRNIRNTRLQPAGLAQEATPRLAPGGALIVIVLLSLGLWGLVWLALSWLASVFF